MLRFNGPVIASALGAALIGCVGKVGNGSVAGDGQIATVDAGASSEVGLAQGSSEVGLGQDMTPETAPPTATAIGGTVFAGATLHQIQITVDRQYLATLDNNAMKDVRVPATLSFDGVVLANVGIRKKGRAGSFASLSDKPGFSVKFDSFVPKQRLDGLKKLILNNFRQDRASLLHESVSYEIGRRAGLATARTAYAQVTFNNMDNGLYLVKEAIDKQFLTRHFGKDFDQGNLYEVDRVDFMVNPARLGLKNETEEMRSRADIVRLAQAARETPDAAWSAAVGALVDLDTFITFYAVEVAISHWDGYCFYNNNTYLYHNPKNDKFVWLLHGTDQALNPLTTGTSRLAVADMPNSQFPRRLRGIPALAARYRAEVQRVVADAWNLKELNAFIDQAATALRSATKGGMRTMAELKAFEEGLASMRLYLQKRKMELMAAP